MLAKAKIRKYLYLDLKKEKAKHLKMIGTLSYDPGRVQCEDETQDAKQTFRLQEKKCEMNH